MGDYTQNREDSIWNEIGQLDEGEIDFEDIIDHLNSSDFRTFGKGLSDVIRRKTPDDCELSEKDFLIKGYKENKVSDNYMPTSATINNWFNKDKRPVKSEAGRNNMFGIAFALKLNTKETEYLFHNVYLDRAFYSRSAKELIYYYCLKNSYSLKHAEELIGKIDFIKNSEDDATVYTSVIREVADNASDDELIKYINEHPHNFTKKNVSAMNTLKKYIDEAKKYVRREYDAGKDIYISDKYSNISPNSNDFMFQTITNQIPNTKKKGTTTIFGNARLPQEIKSRFPEAGTFSKKDPTSEEIRKMIILLFSYCFFYKVEKNDGKNHDFEKYNIDENIDKNIDENDEKYSSEKFDEYFDDYIINLNKVLTDAGMATIYPGNPFDWMFCYCITSEAPLNTLREIIDEAIHG